MTFKKAQEKGHTLSKLSALCELVKACLLLGPENVVPSQYFGTETNMVAQSELGIPVTCGPDYDPVPLPNDDGLQIGIQIVVVTMLVLYQDAMSEFMTSHGIKNICINGGLTPKQRDDRIRAFKNDPTIRVLLMSSVGQVGLNLTNASVIILYVSRTRRGYSD